MIPHCPLHGNINISVHKHWSDNPLLFRALSSPVGVFIDPAQDTSWHPSRTARRASFNSAPSHSSLRASDLLLFYFRRLFPSLSFSHRHFGLLFPILPTKGLDLIDRVPDELWNEVRDTVQETGIKTIPTEKKCKKAKWLAGEALQIAEKRREVKSKGEKGR